MKNRDVDDAIAHARWSVRYALAMIPGHDRKFHPGVRSHASAALTQLDGALKCLDLDQVVVHE